MAKVTMYGADVISSMNLSDVTTAIDDALAELKGEKPTKKQQEYLSALHNAQKALIDAQPIVQELAKIEPTTSSTALAEMQTMLDSVAKLTSEPIESEKTAELEKTADEMIQEAKAAQETAKLAEAEARIASDKKALAALEKAKVKIALSWMQHDAKQRSWMYDIGEKISAFVADYIAHHGMSKRADGVKDVVRATLLATNEDHNDDTSRAIAIYNAAVTFGKENVITLPFNSQKGIALLVERVATPDGKAEAWIVPEKIKTYAHTIVALASVDQTTAPEHIRARLNRGTDGKAHGSDVYSLCSELNGWYRERKGAINPFEVPTTAEPKEKTTTTATAAPAEKTTTTATAAPAEKTTEALMSASDATSEDATLTPTVRGDQDATSIRPGSPINGDKATIALDTKPAIAAAQIVEALMGHSERAAIIAAIAANEAITWESFFSPMLDALVSIERFGAVGKIGLKCDRETKIARYMKEHGASREDARKAMEAKAAEVRAARESGK